MKLFSRIALLAVLCMPSFAAAQELDRADTAWMLTSSALVLFMLLPGLSLFYAGLVRAKNCLLYTSPSPRDLSTSRMPSSA